MQFALPEEKLKERVKELTCLYEISKTISQSNKIEEKVFKKILLSTKKAWRFNDDVIVEIHLKDFYLSTTKKIEETIFQTSLIKIKSHNAGFIKVHYPGNKYSHKHFLLDEQKLLNTIAFEIGNYIEKFQNLEEELLLRRSVERMDRLTILGEMTAGIAHELNTPLGNILGFAELIKDQNTDPLIDSDISTVINSVIYSREIVKKLMFFSCEMPQQLKQEKIKPILIFALSFLQQNFQKKKIKSELIFKDETVSAKIDSVQITQVLFNLIINAIYASPIESTITVIVESTIKSVSIIIKDQGIGIPENLKQKIFDPFFTTKPLNDGCGLGLSVVHGIVKSHEGKIEVKNNFPMGTIFTIKLPIK